MPLCFIYNSEFSAGKGPTILFSFPWYFCLWYKTKLTFLSAQEIAYCALSVLIGQSDLTTNLFTDPKLLPT